MARPALIDSLRDQAARDLEAVWEEVRAQAEHHRAELAAALEQQRARLDAASAAEARRLEEEGEAEAERRAREVRAGAAIALAERLLGLAQAVLPQLRGESAERLFDSLVREVPPCRWQRVRVNPADAALAARHYPGADVAVDPAISGGMELECEDGRIRISNTLETRLATAWPDVLPALIADLERGSHEHAPAA